MANKGNGFKAKWKNILQKSLSGKPTKISAKDKAKFFDGDPLLIWEGEVDFGQGDIGFTLVSMICRGFNCLDVGFRFERIGGRIRPKDLNAVFAAVGNDVIALVGALPPFPLVGLVSEPAASRKAKPRKASTRKKKPAKA